LRHHLFREQIERLADVLMLVAAALLDERHLIDAVLMEAAQMLAQLVRRADAAFATRGRAAAARCGLCLLERVPDIGASRRVNAEAVVMAKRVTEEAETIEPALSRNL